MAFVLKKQTSYVWPVKVEIPISGGRYEKASFDAEFKRLPASKIQEVLSDKSMTDSILVDEILLGWSGVRDSDGNDIEFSEASKSELLEIPGLAGAISRAFFDSIAGSKIKN